MNMLMSCSENILIPGKSISIKTKQNSPRLGIDYEGGSPLENFQNSTSAELDWYIAIGQGQNAIVSDIKCYEDKNETYYTANIKYYLLDVYDWQKDEGESELYNLHLYGMCKSYMEYACYENTITWKKGSRYPEYNRVWDVDITKVKFEGINDNLENSYKKAKEKYVLSTISDAIGG